MNVLLLVLVMLRTPAPAETVRWCSEVQGQAFRHGPFPMCMSGGWGSGKTWAGCAKGLYLSTQFPHNRGLVARHVGRDLRDTTMATWYKVCPPRLYDRRTGGRRNDQNGYLKLSEPYGGSEVLFVHLDDPDTAGFIKGLEINWFLWDQAEENREKAEELFDMLMGRLGRWDKAEVPQVLIDLERADGRAWQFLHPDSGKPVPPPYPMLTVNPEDYDHWIYRRFHPESAEHHTRFKAQGYHMYHMPSEDNRFLSATNREFLLQHDQAFIDRNVLGLWGTSAGTIHHIAPASLVEGTPQLLDYFRNHCLLSRSLDHGDSAPTCCLWWAIDRNGNVFCIREYYQANLIVSKHRQNIYDLSVIRDGVLERYEANLADPSMFAEMPQRKGGRWSFADEYGDVVDQARATAIHWTAADNNELGTRNRINEYLMVDKARVHPITGVHGSPRLFFVTGSAEYPHGCYHVLRETRNQKRVKIGTDLGRPIYSDERDPTVMDHSYDCVAPSSKVLRADLHWVEAGTLEPWTALLAFDENSGGHHGSRKWCPTWVESVTRVRKPAYRLLFDDGTEVVCSWDHQWLTDPASRVNAQQNASKRKWVRTEHLDGVSHWARGRTRGIPDGLRRVLKPLRTWSVSATREGGYLAGFFDGEGSVGKSGISASQRQNVVLEAASRALRTLGFEHAVYHGGGGSKGDVKCVRILGGTADQLRFLGTIRPFRLLNHFTLPTGRFQVATSVGVVRAEFLGGTDLVSIQTASRTFICEGLASHNCVRYLIASRPGLPAPLGPRVEGTFNQRRREAKEFRRRMSVR